MYLVRGMAFSPDSTKLAVAQSDNIVFVYRCCLECKMCDISMKLSILVQCTAVYHNLPSWRLIAALCCLACNRECIMRTC
jgi:hypothetical protein